MKKTFILAALFAAVLAPVSLLAFDSPATATSVNADWKKVKEGAWKGTYEGKSYWYKLDKSAKLWWSADMGKTWAEVKDGMWADKDGKWLKIGDNKLWWSADMGKTWAEVPEWKWQGPDGEWYKFDKDWNLWKNA